MTEPTLLESFKDNPVFFFLAFLLGVMALIVAAVALISAFRGAATARPIAIVALVMAGGTIGLGAIGASLNHSRTLAVLTSPGLSAHDKERILAYEEKVQFHNLAFGAAASTPGELLAIIALVMSRKRKA